jgi:hypothetical protein
VVIFSYQNNNEIQAMISLVDAYQHHEIRTFEDVHNTNNYIPTNRLFPDSKIHFLDCVQVLKKHHKAIMGDEFIADYISDLMKKMRCEVLLKLIQPYNNIRIPFIAKVISPSFLLTTK